MSRLVSGVLAALMPFAWGSACVGQGGSACQAEESEVASLLQSGGLGKAKALQVAALRVHSACSCLTWKDVYASRNVRCGMGHELAVWKDRFDREELPEKAPSGWDFFDEWCTRFYMQVSSSTCFNVRIGSPSQQWCYVSPECEGAERVPGADAAIKMCGEGDHFQNATTPEELNQMGTDMNLERGLLGKLSYAVDGKKWNEVESASGLDDYGLFFSHTLERAYGLEWGGRKEVTPEGKAKFDEVEASGIPTIFDSDNGHGGGTVVYGSKIYMFMPLDETHGWGYVCYKGC